jgi:hypothetical protein
MMGRLNSPAELQEAAMVSISEPSTLDYIPASFPQDDFPRYDWVEKPAGLALEPGRPRRSIAMVSRVDCRPDH